MKVGDIIKLPDGRYLEKVYSGKASIEDLSTLARAQSDYIDRLEEENDRLEQAYQKAVTDFVKFKQKVEELDILDEFSNFFENKKTPEI